MKPFFSAEFGATKLLFFAILSLCNSASVRADAGLSGQTGKDDAFQLRLQGKGVVVEPNVFRSFSNWTQVVGPNLVQSIPITVESVAQHPSMNWLPAIPPYPSPVTTDHVPLYKPEPVILGMPDLPLTGRDLTRGSWTDQVNYQGAQIRLVILKRDGTQHVLSNLAYSFQPGDKFKIRVAPSFNALVSLDQIVGLGTDPWLLRRMGQVYPSAGNAVSIPAGWVMDLPIEKEQYFQLESQIAEKIVINLRHQKGSFELKSDQPVYRQDGSAESSLVQLVPRGKFPAFELLIGNTASN
jgi:hypothetical protein